jgi:hypothetical protein
MGSLKETIMAAVRKIIPTENAIRSSIVENPT